MLLKTLHRILIVLLSACLVVDPALAAAPFRQTASIHGTSRVLFKEQALAVELLSQTRAHAKSAHRWLGQWGVKLLGIRSQHARVHERQAASLLPVLQMCLLMAVALVPGFSQANSPENTYRPIPGHLEIPLRGTDPNAALRLQIDTLLDMLKDRPDEALRQLVALGPP